MPAPKILLPIVALAGAAIVAARRKKRFSAPSTEITVVDSGIGFAKAEGQNVDWKILKRSGSFGWTWTGRADRTASASSAFVFPSRDAAFASLRENTDLAPVPVPEGVVQERPPQAAAGGPGTVLVPPLPEPAFWGPPPPGSIVYPPGGDPKSAPYLEDPEDLVFSDDCSLVVVGPDWWDKIGEFVESMESTDANALYEMILDAEFPPGCDDVVATGAQQLRDELWDRIQQYVTQEAEE